MVSAIWTPPACAAEQQAKLEAKLESKPRLLIYHTPTSFCLVGNAGVETCTNFFLGIPICQPVVPS